MTLTQKETTLLSDLKSQEQLCIEKYTKYSQMAHDPELKNLFSTLSQNEQKHLDTISQILNGNEVEKRNDAYLCRDALSMEKHVSGVYNTGVFEFSNPVLRDTLAHIQNEEQTHGEQLYNYLSCNNMYS